MPTFRLYSKTRIGGGDRFLAEGAFVQISKKGEAEPSSSEIKKAVKQQLGVDLHTVHLGQFNWEMIK